MIKFFIPTNIRFLLTSLLLILGNICSSQELLWQVGIHNLFDNSEFATSPTRASRTMSGTHIQPIIGIGIDSKHQILAGTDLNHEWGNNQLVSKAKLIAHYRYNIPNFEFNIGAFPKKVLLGRYPRNMFSDSVYWAQPVINGFFIEYRHNKSYANFWLDWAEAEKAITYEAFYIGWSGRLQKNIFHIQHFGYMFHQVMFDNKYSINNTPSISVKDNVKTVTALGIDFDRHTVFNRLESSIGASVSMERDRKTGETHIPVGLIWESDIEFRGLGLKNTFYYGNSQQKFYSRYGNHLYWGDLMYKTQLYDRVDFIVYFYKSNILNIKLELSLHVAERRIYNQQILTASFDIDNFRNKTLDKSYKYIWDNIF